MNMYCGRDTYCSTGATSLVDVLEPCGSHRTYIFLLINVILPYIGLAIDMGFIKRSI